MIQLKRTNTLGPDFKTLVEELDNDLFSRYPEIQQVYVPLNKVESIDTALIAYEFDNPVGCGCFKTYNQDSVEIKRMFVKPIARGKGISKLILNELLNWATELGYKKAILETGLNQPEAIGLYEKAGFKKIENFGPYLNMSNSICFEKIL
jgi:putative acetyltransferase